MKVYFAYTIRGDKTRIQVARQIVDMLKQRGHQVMTEIFLRDNAEDEGVLTDQEIFERDIKWLDECDVLVSEVSGSSFGIGYELAYILSKKKRAFVFYHNDAKQNISKMAVGNTHENCSICPYNDTEQIRNFIEKNF